MGLAARVIWISHRISSGNTDESVTLRGRETVLGFHAEKEVMRMLTAEKVRLWNITKDGEPCARKRASTVRGGGHAIPSGSTVPTLRQDFTQGKAPNGFCKHRLAHGLYRRATEIVQTQEQ